MSQALDDPEIGKASIVLSRRWETRFPAIAVD
jgi:hypothetical protein